MAARSVGTRPMTDYLNGNAKLNASMQMAVGIGKGSSRDKPRVPVRSAEAGTPSPGSGNTMIESLENMGDLGN